MEPEEEAEKMDYSFLYCDETLTVEDQDEEMQLQNNDGEEMQQENNGGAAAADDDDGGDDDDEMNYIQILLARETTVARLTDQRIAEIMNNNWDREVRTLAVDYILRTGERFQFCRQTLYRSVLYVDRFLADQIIPNGDRCTVRLLAVTCLSLSAKSNEFRGHMPSLSSYPVGNHYFTVDDIKTTELLVLNELNWKMNCVTPFSFTRFFVSRFCEDAAARYTTRMRTFDIIMSVISDVRLMNHRPSVIAAAATSLAVNTNLTAEVLEILINDLPINGSLPIDDVCYCYYRLRELMNI